MDITELEDLVRQHGSALYSFCCRLTGNRVDADDLYQDSFLKAIEQCAKLNRDKNPKSMLFSIAIYRWKQNKRKYARRQRLAPTAPEDNAQAIAAETDIEGGLIASEQKAAVQHAVSTLSERHRILIYLHYTGQMPVEDIAATLGLPAGTVKSRMHKARTIIKKRLEDMSYAPNR